MPPVSPNGVALERMATNGIKTCMTVRWPSRAEMAFVVAEPQNSRDVETRDRASVMSVARKIKKMAPRPPPFENERF